jgi:hypothetical protein
MTTRIRKGASNLNAYIIAYADGETEHIALAVAKNTGELFVCHQVISVTADWWEATTVSPNHYKWEFVRPDR